MNRPPLGERELELLRFVSERAPVSVGDVSEQWGEPLGLTRSTVQVMMERLRQKSYLIRRKEANFKGFAYRPRMAEGELMRSVVAQFVERTLGGSLTPFVAYLSDVEGLSAEELAALRKVVDSLEHRQEEPK
jgi:predicted transcriptional regulator